MLRSYELATLSVPLLSVSKMAEDVRAWVDAPEAGGTFLGSWRTEIGALGHLLVLRGFENADDLGRERQRALLSSNPFNVGSVATALDMSSYAPFPFLPPVEQDARAAVYEFRTYRLKPAGLAPTLTGWEQAMAPARHYTSHLLIAMFALDGAPRITHIWGFSTLEERAALRAQAYGAGVWPPSGGPENILEATSTIAVLEPYASGRA